MFVLFGWATFLIVLESYPELRSNNIFEAFIFKFASILLYGSFALGVYFLSSLTICIIGIKGNPRRESDTAVVNLLPTTASQDVWVKYKAETVHFKLFYKFIINHSQYNKRIRPTLPLFRGRFLIEKVCFQHWIGMLADMIGRGSSVELP